MKNLMNLRRVPLARVRSQPAGAAVGFAGVETVHARDFAAVHEGGGEDGPVV